MSVLVTMRVDGDTEQFRRFLDEGADRLRAISDAARAVGAIHHRFGVGDGYVLVVDEWESQAAFEQFLHGNPDLPGVMRDAGARAEPQVTFLDAVSSPDEF